ncbi:hypothetical protein D5086_012337 [Populus alba]|uniref:Uncharacterized protein n=1 Tax=Populus alba TaxID=43335 RepID=A0ACC4C3F2_POPAL
MLLSECQLLWGFGVAFCLRPEYVTTVSFIDTEFISQNRNFNPSQLLLRVYTKHGPDSKVEDFESVLYSGCTVQALAAFDHRSLAS